MNTKEYLNTARKWMKSDFCNENFNMNNEFVDIFQWIRVMGTDFHRLLSDAW